jgi:CBS domain containing-hemolysin-like protein
MRRALRLAAGACAVAAALPAHASFLSGDAVDTAANWLAWFVIVVMPIAAIAAFLYVHVLPEVIAEKRHHPHKDSIKVLCILSLFFGGLLWPFAWLWAYTKPIGYRAIYGTEKHEDYYLEMGEKAHIGVLSAEEIAQLRAELAAIDAKGALSSQLQRVSADLDALIMAQAGERKPLPAQAVAGGGE